MHKKKKHSIWINRTTLPETYNLWVFQLFTYQNTKTHTKHHLWKTEHHCQKKRVYWVFFFRFLGIKMRKWMQNTVYEGNRTTLPEKKKHFITYIFGNVVSRYWLLFMYFRILVKKKKLKKTLIIHLSVNIFSFPKVG